jgi:hypothetical protein
MSHWKALAVSAIVASVVVVAFAKSNTLRGFVGLPANA